VRRLVLIAVPLAVAACGGGAHPASPPRVTVRLTAPADTGTVRADKVHVEGTVSPVGASVQVDGKDASVEGTKFTADVALAPGANVIDVTATAPGRRPDADALRIMRDTRIEIPDLSGQKASDAEQKLSDLGLAAKEDRQDGFLNRIFGGDAQVCETQPNAGELVGKGTTVTVVVASDC
jgi:hypothetical protein